MTVDQITGVLGWLFGGFLAIAVIELLFFVGVQAIRSTKLVFNFPTRLFLLFVLLVVCIGSIAGTVIFVHSRVTLTLALPASVRFLERHNLRLHFFLFDPYKSGNLQPSVDKCPQPDCRLAEDKRHRPEHEKERERQEWGYKRS